jgi:hypothetical protein
VLKIMGVILILVALVIAIVPQFTDCYSQGHQIDLGNGKVVPMKCHWSAIGEIGVAIPLFVVGVLMLVSKRKESFYILSILGLVLSAIIILLPTKMIGVCATPTMTCVTTMKPILLIAGVIAIIANLVALLYTARMKE